jgi:hypothetical protein
VIHSPIANIGQFGSIVTALFLSFFEGRLFSRWIVTNTISARETLRCRKTRVACGDQLVICGLYLNVVLSCPFLSSKCMFSNRFLHYNSVFIISLPHPSCIPTPLITPRFHHPGNTRKPVQITTFPLRNLMLSISRLRHPTQKAKAVSLHAMMARGGGEEEEEEEV